MEDVRVQLLRMASPYLSAVEEVFSRRGDDVGWRLFLSAMLDRGKRRRQPWLQELVDRAAFTAEHDMPEPWLFEECDDEA